MTVRFRVEVSPQAHDQITTINLWWVRNRPTAPTLVAAELEAAIQQLATSPESGRLHDGGKPVQVRKLLMPRSRYRLYYEVDPVSRLVTVLGVWVSMLAQYSGRVSPFHANTGTPALAMAAAASSSKR